MTLTDNQKILLFIVAAYFVYTYYIKDHQEGYYGPKPLQYETQCKRYGTTQSTCNSIFGKCYWVGTKIMGSCKALL